MNFKECVQIISGGTPKTTIPEYWNGNIPWLSVVDFENCTKYVYKSGKTITKSGLDNSSTKVLNKDDIIISARGTVGALAMLASPMAFNQSCFGLRTINDTILNQHYLFYFMTNYVSNLREKARGSSVFPAINLDTFNLIDLDLINIKEQKRISYLLDLTDRKIQNNKMINDNLLQLIDLHFEELIFSDRVDNKRFTIQNMYDNILFSIQKPGINEFNDKIYLATSEIDGLSIKDGWKINYNTRESRANMQPTVNSVWFAKMKNSVKHLFLNQYMNYYINNTILSTGFYGLQCSEQSFEYVASLINNKNFEKLKDVLSHGATQQGIGDDDLKNIKIKVPDENLLQKYHELTKPLFDVLLKHINENRKLVSLRDFLLPLLMNGQATIE